MRFSIIVLVALALVGATAYYGESRATAATVVSAPTCHVVSPGVYFYLKPGTLAVVGAGDIVLPTKGNAGKNFNGANVGIMAFGCKTPSKTVMPPAPPKPADPNAGKYSLEMGPVLP